MGVQVVRLASLVWLVRGANEGVNRSAHFIAIAASWQGETPTRDVRATNACARDVIGARTW
jgi:hypothetical protein